MEQFGTCSGHMSEHVLNHLGTAFELFFLHFGNFCGNFWGSAGELFQPIFDTFSELFRSLQANKEKLLLSFGCIDCSKANFRYVPLYPLFNYYIVILVALKRFPPCLTIFGHKTAPSILNFLWQNGTLYRSRRVNS